MTETKNEKRSPHGLEFKKTPFFFSHSTSCYCVTGVVTVGFVASLVCGFFSSFLSCGSSWHHMDREVVFFRSLDKDFMRLSHGSNDMFAPLLLSQYSAAKDVGGGACIYS